MSDQGFFHDGFGPPGNELELGTRLEGVGGDPEGLAERIRTLSGKGGWSTRGSRVLWEGKAAVPSAFRLEKVRQGNLWRLQAQTVPELGSDLNPPLTFWENLLFRACHPEAPHENLGARASGRVSQLHALGPVR